MTRSPREPRPVPIRRYRYTKWRWRVLVHALDAVGGRIMRLWRRLRPLGAWNSPRRILVVQLDHLGDSVLSSPIFPRLQAAFPEAVIDVLASPSNRAVFEAAGCRSCHRVGGKGGDAGPDLTLVGHRRSRAWLEVWLSKPSAWKADTRMPDPRLAPGDRAAIADYLASLKGPGLWRRPGLSGAELGRAVYRKAGCAACHGGAGLRLEHVAEADLETRPRLVDALVQLQDLGEVHTVSAPHEQRLPDEGGTPACELRLLGP